MLLAHYNNLKNRQKKKKKGRFSRSRALLGHNSEDSGTEDLYAGYRGASASLDNLSKYVGPCDQSSDDLDDFIPTHLAMCDKSDDENDITTNPSTSNRTSLNEDALSLEERLSLEEQNLREEIRSLQFEERCVGDEDEFVNIPSPDTESSSKGFPQGQRSPRSSREYPDEERRDGDGDTDEDVFEDFFDSVQGDSVLGDDSTSFDSELHGSLDLPDNVSIESSTLRQRQKEFRSHPFFLLEGTLKEGRELVIRDSCGTSDPYVKFKIGNRLLFRSRTIFKNLNPRWEEKFAIPIEDPQKSVRLSVFDYDRGMNDDPMGACDLDPSTLELNTPTELKLPLKAESSRRKKEAYMGYLLLNVTLVPKTQDEKEQYFKKASKQDVSKKSKTQQWSAVVTLVLVEGRKLIAMDDNGFSDPYVKFRLGTEKWKSKYKSRTLNPKWVEQVDFYMYEDTMLEVSVWDHDIGGKDDIMGRKILDLSKWQPESTHRVDCELDDGAGVVHFLMTITATMGSDAVSDLATYEPDPQQQAKIINQYSVKNSLRSINDVGWLEVKVIKAQGLAAADIGGKSDPFCVLELVNDRLQTHTEYKTLYPEWGKIFRFNVKDIHAVLEVTVYDEDRDKKTEFLGKVAIPLLRVRNGEKRWYTLKDKKTMIRTKGAILLELTVVFNHVRAAIRTFNPREEKYIEPDRKFKISVMKRNIDRMKKIGADAAEGGKVLQSCFDWESKPRSIAAFAAFLIIAWTFELYLIPISLLIVFMVQLIIVQVMGSLMNNRDEDEYVDEEDDEDEPADDKDKPKKAGQEEKKSFKEKLQQIQEVCLQVQEGMDMAASMGERVKNIFNWTVPWLSWLLVVILCIGTVVLYYVPLRYLIIAFGINKFTKKLRKPNAIPNNELLDYISRVPSDRELIMYRELRPDSSIGTVKRKKQA